MLQTSQEDVLELSFASSRAVPAPFPPPGPELGHLSFPAGTTPGFSCHYMGLMALYRISVKG